MIFLKRKDKKVLDRTASPTEKKMVRVENRASRYVFYFLAISFLSVSGYVFIFSDFLKIKNIIIEGNEKIASEEIREKVDNLSIRRLPGNLSWQNYFFISDNQLEQDLKRDFKKINKVEVVKIFPETLLVKVEERKALVLRCAGDTCHLIDEEGVAYEEIDPESEDLKKSGLIKLIDKSGRQVETGEKIMTAEFVSFLLSLKEKLEAEKIYVKDEWIAPSLIAEEITVSSLEGWNIYFSSRIDSEKSIRMLKLFLNEEIKDMREKLEYADLRVENKVYYRLKPEEDSKEEDAVETESQDSF